MTMNNKTIFDKTIEELTLDKLAALNVRMVLINGVEPMYVSSTGQLFRIDNLNEALEYEKKWLSTEIPEQDKESDK